MFIISDLMNMYRLLQPIHSGLSVLVAEVETHIRQMGLNAVSSLTGENVSPWEKTLSSCHENFSLKKKHLWKCSPF